MDILPQFTTGELRYPRAVVNYNDGDCWMATLDNGYCRSMGFPWDSRIEEFLLEHQPQGLWISLFDMPDAVPRIADFVRRHAWLHGIHLHLDTEQWDLTPLEAIDSLREIRFFIPSLLALDIPDFPAFNFASLPNLSNCAISYCQQFESLLTCSGLRQLGIDGNLPQSRLDLGQLANLKAVLIGSSTVNTVTWPVAHNCHALGLTSASKLSLSPEVGQWARYLDLGGRLKFDIADVCDWQQLRILELTQVPKIPKLDFLLDLPSMVAVNFRFPCGPKSKELDDDNKAVIRKINERSGYGDVLFVQKYKEQHLA
jgi:hypothetical protein